MICWAVEVQVLQIRNEVRDGALVYALTLTENVKLKNKRRVIKIQQIASDSLMAYDTLDPGLSPYQTSQRAWHWADESCR